MLGLVWGALASIGLILIFEARANHSPRQMTLRPALFPGLGVALGVGLITWLVQVPVLSVISFVVTLASLRQHRISRTLRQLQRRGAAWPDAIDFLISNIRAGMSIGPGLIALSESGPAVLRPVLFPTREALLRGATVSQELQLLKAHAQDPIADRIALILEISQSVGGTSLGTILRSLSTYVRAEMRTREELISRQSWTINAAKLAVAAPWFIVLLLSIRAHDSYATTSGSILLLLGSVATSAGYGWMKRAARLPTPTRLA